MRVTGKKFSIGIIAALLLYIIITLIICEFEGGAEFWISFAYMCFAFLLVAGVAYFVSAKFASLRDWVFSLPIFRWCFYYLVAELAVSIIFMLLPLGWKLTFIIQLLLIVAFIALVMPSIFQRDYAEAVREKTKTKVAFTRTLHAKLVGLLPRAGEDAELSALLSETAEALRHSDPMSHEALAGLENKITNLVVTLDGQIKSGDFENAKAACKELNYSIGERSQMARAMKLSQY